MMSQLWSLRHMMQCCGDAVTDRAIMSLVSLLKTAITMTHGAPGDTFQLILSRGSHSASQDRYWLD